MQRIPSIISEIENLHPSPTAVLVLRRLRTTWLRIGPRLPDKLMGLPTDYSQALGPQIVLPLSDVAGALAEAHICGVVQYKFNERPTFIIPFCGMVRFNFET
jgi:hypothetical protein